MTQYKITKKIESYKVLCSVTSFVQHTYKKVCHSVVNANELCVHSGDHTDSESHVEYRPKGGEFTGNKQTYSYSHTDTHLFVFVQMKKYIHRPIICV